MEEDEVCDFCSRRRKEVYHLIVSDWGAICDECVEVCSKIVADKRKGGEIGEWFEDYLNRNATRTSIPAPMVAVRGSGAKI